MRYIAKKGSKNKNKELEFIISGIKTLKTVDGQEVEVVVDTIKYTKEHIESVIDDLESKYQGMTDKYNTDMEDLRKYLVAIAEAK